jgi:hypothetical protein
MQITDNMKGKDKKNRKVKHDGKTEQFYKNKNWLLP